MIKHITLAATFLSLTSNTLSLAMNKSELVPLIDCSLKISTNEYGKSVEYLPQQYHTDLFDENQIKSSLRDPMLYVKILTLRKNDYDVLGGSYGYLPARLFCGFNDGSFMRIYFNNGADFTFKKEELYIDAKLIKNKKIYGDSFAEQFNNVMSYFYLNPNSLTVFRHRKEFVNANIVKEHKRIQGNITTRTVSHGSNGITNQQDLIKLALSSR